MENNETRQEQEQPRYEPRPMWQVWMARVGLVLFVLLILWQMVQMAGGFF